MQRPSGRVEFNRGLGSRAESPIWDVSTNKYPPSASPDASEEGPPRKKAALPEDKSHSSPLNRLDPIVELLNVRFHPHVVNSRPLPNVH